MRELGFRSVCVGMLCASAAFCASLQWNDTLRRALDLQRQQQYTEAESLLEGLISDAGRSQPQDARVAVALHNLASVYHDTGRYLDAEKAYLQSIAILEQTLGPRHPFLVKTGLNNLAELYLETGALAKAKALLDRAMAIADADPAVDAKTRATLLINLASIHAQRGRHAEAESLFVHALSLDPAEPNAGTALNNLAALAAMRDDIPAALSYAERAVSILRPHELDEPSQLARALVNRGLLEAKLGATRTAETDMKQALAIAERAFGDRHPVTATALSSYAAVLRGENHKREAKKMEERASAIQAQSRKDNALGMTIDARALMASARRHEN